MDFIAPIVVERIRDVHRRLREQIQDLDTEAVQWTPGPETSSIAILVAHMLGSEGDVLKSVRGLPSDRVRATEFESRNQTAADLLRRLDEADALLEELGSAMTSDDMGGDRARPNREPKPGLYWLADSFGHLREHLGQLELTRQLYLQQRQAAR